MKTCRDNIRNLHILAPEWGDDNLVPDTPVDIYAFGMCALETAALEINSRFVSICVLTYKEKLYISVIQSSKDF